MNIILLGPQGSGKGTQGKLLSQHFEIPHISTGQLLRDIAAKDTPLAQEVRDIMQRGDLVSDKILLEVLGERLKEPDAQRGVLLDGTPRNKAQAQLINSLLDVDAVIFMDITDEEAIDRASHRWHCPKDGHMYNLKTRPPEQKGVCDECGTTLVQREDDNPKSIHERLLHYHQDTKPLIDYYRKKGLLVEVNGMQPVRNVFASILHKLQQHQPARHTVA